MALASYTSRLLRVYVMEERLNDRFN